MWENRVEPDRTEVTVKYGACALHAGYLRLQTNTLKICNTYCFTKATVVTRTRFTGTFMRTLPVLFNVCDTQFLELFVLIVADVASELFNNV